MRQENVAALAGDRTVSDNRGAMADSPHLSVCVLGPARVMVDGAAAPPELLWRKHLALLVYLARSPRKSRTREHLLGLLWSDRTEALARHSLSEALRVLRRVLGDTAVQADVDQVRLATDRVTLDCDRFAAHAERGEWDSAAALVEGEFLEGLALPDANQFETWRGAGGGRAGPGSVGGGGWRPRPRRGRAPRPLADRWCWFRESRVKERRGCWRRS